MISTNIEENLSTLLNEKQIAKYVDETCPREITKCKMEKLLSELSNIIQLSIPHLQPNYVPLHKMIHQ